MCVTLPVDMSRWTESEVMCWRYRFWCRGPRCIELTSRLYQMCSLKMRTVLYGKKAANLYTQAFVQNTQARALYQESEDTYYRANDAASYDDWRRARHQWDYFYNRH